MYICTPGFDFGSAPQRRIKPAVCTAAKVAADRKSRLRRERDLIIWTPRSREYTELLAASHPAVQVGGWNPLSPSGGAELPTCIGASVCFCISKTTQKDLNENS